MLEETTAIDLIKCFFTVQERRAASYNRFHSGFDRHLSGSMGAGDYCRLCGEITSEMGALSLEALAVEEALNAASLESLAACIRVVQLGEKAKLRMTCTLQVLKKTHSERKWTWQRTPEEVEEAEVSVGSEEGEEEEQQQEEEQQEEAAAKEKIPKASIEMVERCRKLLTNICA